MKKLLSLMMLLMMIFGTVSFAENTENDPLATILSGMTLRDKVAQMMIASFRVWKEVPPEGEPQPEQQPPKVNITELNDEIRDMVSRNHFGGILLYGQNIVDAEQTLRLISDYQTANQAGGGLPRSFLRIRKAETSTGSPMAPRVSVTWPSARPMIRKTPGIPRRFSARSLVCWGFQRISRRWWTSTTTR